MGKPGFNFHKAGVDDQDADKLLPSHFIDVSKLVNDKYKSDFAVGVTNQFSDKVPMWRACGGVCGYARRQEEGRRRREKCAV